MEYVLYFAIVFNVAGDTGKVYIPATTGGEITFETKEACNQHFVDMKEMAKVGNKYGDTKMAGFCVPRKYRVRLP